MVLILQNDARTRGHPSYYIIKVKSCFVEHLPFTHSEYTRRNKNILLQENPDHDDSGKSYILNGIEVSSVNCVGKIKENMKITNAVDKSVIRHIKKNNKKTG